MSNPVRETLPARVSREQLPELRKSPDYFETCTGRYMVVTENGERRVCRLKVEGERDYESTTPAPNVTVDDDGDIAVPLDGPYIEPDAKSIAEVERLLDAREVEVLLDGMELINWRRWPSAPPSIMSAGKLMYSHDDVIAWVARTRNAFCDVGDLSFDWDGNVTTPL